MKEWEELTLNDVTLKVTDGSHYSPKDQEEGYTMLSSKDMRENDFDYSDVKYISEDDYFKLVRGDCKPLKNDILIIKDGNSYLKHIFMCKEEREQVVLSSIAIVRPNSKKVYPLYLTYFLKSNRVKEEMAVYLSGAAIPRIILDDFKKVKVSLPPLPIQRRIADILGRYDALIENYQKQISTLEGMAQELYREWFVRGRCPYAEPGEDGGLPVGWEYTELGNISDLIQRGISPQYDDEGKILCLNQRCVRDGKIDYLVGRMQTKEVSPNRLVRFGDVLINSTGEGTLGRTAQIYNKLVDRVTVDSHVTIARPKADVAPEYYGFVVAGLQDYFESMALGSTGQTELLREVISKAKVLHPDKNSMKKFGAITAPMFDKIANLQTQLSTLRQTRDMLLPRLLSGQLEVKGEFGELEI